MKNFFIVSTGIFDACMYVEYILPNVMMLSLALIGFLSIFILRAKPPQ